MLLTLLFIAYGVMEKVDTWSENASQRPSDELVTCRSDGAIQAEEAIAAARKEL